MRRPFSTPLSTAVVVVALAAPFVVAAAPTSGLLAQAASANSAAPSGSASGSADDVAKAKEEAKEHFIKGVSLMQEEQWDAALVEFNASVAL